MEYHRWPFQVRYYLIFTRWHCNKGWTTAVYHLNSMLLIRKFCFKLDGKCQCVSKLNTVHPAVHAVLIKGKLTLKNRFTVGTISKTFLHRKSNFATVKPAYSDTIGTLKIWQCNWADPIAGKYLLCRIRVCWPSRWVYTILGRHYKRAWLYYKTWLQPGYYLKQCLRKSLALAVQYLQECEYTLLKMAPIVHAFTSVKFCSIKHLGAGNVYTFMVKNRFEFCDCICSVCYFPFFIVVF